MNNVVKHVTYYLNSVANIEIKNLKKEAKYVTYYLNSLVNLEIWYLNNVANNDTRFLYKMTSKLRI